MNEIGNEVIRVQGAIYQIGSKGTVVEINGDRLRVLWHTNTHPGTKPKRTWVNRSVVKSLS